MGRQENTMLPTAATDCFAFMISHGLVSWAQADREFCTENRPAVEAVEARLDQMSGDLPIELRNDPIKPLENAFTSGQVSLESICDLIMRIDPAEWRGECFIAAVANQLVLAFRSRVWAARNVRPIL